jgi:hypothetical protein
MLHSPMFRVLIEKPLTHRRCTSSTRAEVLIVIADALQMRVKLLIATGKGLEIG